MKSFIKKLSTMALFVFVMSSSIFAKSKTTDVTVIFPSKDFGLYEEKKDLSSWKHKKSLPEEGDWQFNTYTWNPKGRDSYRYTVTYKGGDIVTRDVGKFGGRAAWNWKFDLNGTETMEALDSDKKTVMGTTVLEHPLNT
jgi:hypothetical protein